MTNSAQTCPTCGSSDIKKLHTVPMQSFKFYVYQCQNCGAKITGRMYGWTEKEDGAPNDPHSARNFLLGFLALIFVLAILLLVVFLMLHPPAR